MNPNLVPSLNKMLLGSFVLVFFFDLAYALLALFTHSSILYQSGLLDLSFLPLWIYALLDLRLQQKKAEEQELSAKRSDHLFDQSFEHVVLQRQIDFAKTKLQPLAVILTLGMMAAIVLNLMQQTWFAPSELSNSVQAAFLLFRGGISFVVARYLQGVAKSSKATHLETLAGLSLHHALFLIMLGLRCFLNRDGLAFLAPTTLAFSIVPIVIYLLEVPLRAIHYYYSSTKPLLPPQTPLWLWFRWGKELSSGAKSAISYQFGYDLSSSLKEIGKKNAFSLGPIFLICLWAGTCMHIVPTGHQGILIKFKRIEKVLEAGLHFSLPWPLGEIETLQTAKIHSMEIGGIGQKRSALLWNQGGHREETYLIFQDGYGQHDLPIEVYAVNALLTYRIKDILAYRYQHCDPEKTIRCETKSWMSQGALQLSRASLLGLERIDLNSTWKQNLQIRMDELNLGIELLHFGLPQIHPPSETNESFQQLAIAHNQRYSKILEAQGVAKQKMALQDSATYEQLQTAYTQATKILTQTDGDYQTLKQILPVAALNVQLFTTRRLLQKMIDLKDSMRKVALFSQTEMEVQSLNLEPSFEPELLNLNLE